MIVTYNAISLLLDSSVSLVALFLVLVDLHRQVGGLLLQSVDLPLEQIDLIRILLVISQELLISGSSLISL